MSRSSPTLWSVTYGEASHFPWWQVDPCMIPPPPAYTRDGSASRKLLAPFHPNFRFYTPPPYHISTVGTSALGGGAQCCSFPDFAKRIMPEYHMTPPPPSLSLSLSLLVSGRGRWSPCEVPPHILVGKPLYLWSMDTTPVLVSALPFFLTSPMELPPPPPPTNAFGAYGSNICASALGAICLPFFVPPYLPGAAGGCGTLFQRYLPPVVFPSEYLW